MPKADDNHVNDVTGGSGQLPSSSGGGIGIASAIGNILSSIMSFFGQSQMMAKSIDANIAQWNRENEYNSPAAQMARYKAAGLNPNLIYGQQNTASQMTPSSDVPSFHAGDPVSAGVSAGIQGMQAEANLELTKAQTKKTLQDTETSAARQEAIIHGLYLADETLNLRYLEYDQKERDLIQRWARMAKLNEKTDDERKVLTQQFENLIAQKKETEKKIELMDEQKALVVAQTIKQKFDNEHAQETFDLMKQRTYAEIAKMYSEKDLNESEKAQVDEDIKFLQRSLENRLMSLSNSIDLQNMDYSLKQQNLRNMKAELIAAMDDVYRNSNFVINMKEGDEFGISKDNNVGAGYTFINILLQTLGFSSGAYYSASSVNANSTSQHLPSGTPTHVTGFRK